MLWGLSAEENLLALLGGVAATVRTEMGRIKVAAGTVIVQCFIAWAVAFIEHRDYFRVSIRKPCCEVEKLLLLKFNQKEHSYGR